MGSNCNCTYSRPLPQGFNTELEELQKIQRHYTITDRELRSLVKEANQDLIHPVYEEFYRK